MTQPRLSPDEAYRTMLRFLEQYRARGSGSLTDLLSDMQLVAGDNRPADPAIWTDWLDAIDAETPLRPPRAARYKATG